MTSSDESSDDYSSTTSNNNNNSADELDRLKRECQAMLTLIKRLRTQEEDLRDKNRMLAREALLCGFQLEQLEAPPPKRRMTKPTKKDDK